MTSDLISDYFPNVSSIQKDQFNQLGELYRYWNAQINIISRKDIDMLYLHHILHSLAIAKVISFLPGETVLDVGTGGGLPGIPLAILFPETTFHLVDSIGKKIKVVREITTSLSLKNTTATHNRADQVDEHFDFVVSRAVTQLKDFYPWVSGKFNRHSKNLLKNGVLYLKGGDLTEEIAGSGLKNVHCFPVNDYFTEEFFNQKFILYFSAQ
ncbi:MAG: 16S rRNA (guanine(527)-N(7))-methyltransferase RsmG [Flavobacterium sp.]|nr:16S rRNA (guanine(527)-N(7))-methyltransferase RsmG [Pedobacter sp.]